jgi:ribose-phosphate pyrophosphokinase
VCAPDAGAREFATQVYDYLDSDSAGLLFFAKQRTDERSVSSIISPESPCPVESIAGKDVIVFDDMVRTGNTIRECCRLLKEAGAGRVVFFVTHFYSSSEVRETLATPAVDEIVTTNTIPSILNRDMQGRLRRKLTVLKLEKWISRYSPTRSRAAPTRWICRPRTRAGASKSSTPSTPSQTTPHWTSPKTRGECRLFDLRQHRRE